MYGKLALGWMILTSLSVSSVVSAESCRPQEKSPGCFECSGTVEWKYCVRRPVTTGNDDVLFHFHGRNLNEKAWIDRTFYTQMIRDSWKSTGHRTPTVVSISLGPVWLLAEKNKAPFSGLYETMTKEILPAVEKEIGGIKGRRLLVGESMGGYNATLVALKARTLFEKVAILCPPFPEDISPFSTEAEITAFIKKTGADPKRVQDMVRLGRAFFADKEAFEKNSPLALAATHLDKSSPKLYVSCGAYDEFGAYSGVEKFARIAKEKGASVEWRPLWGGHCAVDIHSLAAFLVN